MKTVEEKKIYKVISITNQVYYKKKEKKKRFPAMCYICTVSVRLFSHKELRMETDWLKGILNEIWRVPFTRGALN